MRRALAAVLCLACGDPPGNAPAAPFVWSVDLAELDDALLSVWIGGPDEVIAVGGGAGRGVVYEWDGERWDAPPLPDDTGALWWIWALPGGDAFAVGDGGTVLRRAGGLWRRELVGDLVAEDQILYGVHGFAPDDVWIVGGTLLPRPMPGVILHWDGLVFSAEPAEALLFKVWGAAAGDLWAVGEGGAILHGDGATFAAVPSSTTDRLIAVYGRASDDVYAVGGAGVGRILRWDGAAWRTFATTPEALSGVWTAPARPLYVGGARGYLARLGDAPAELVAIPDVDFHALGGAGDLVVAVGADLQSGGGGERWRGALASHGASLSGPIDPPARPDAAPVPDADPGADGGTGGPGEGEPCLTHDGGVPTCRSDLQCWYLAVDGTLICTESCASPADCAAYGDGACCAPPGPQTFETQCIPRGTSTCP
jgi:hypothetical protein